MDQVVSNKNMVFLYKFSVFFKLWYVYLYKMTVIFHKDNVIFWAICYHVIRLKRIKKSRQSQIASTVESFES